MNLTNIPCKLSDELSVKQAASGAGTELYKPTGDAPCAPLLVLSDKEMVGLVAWWHERHVQAGPYDDLITLIVELVHKRQIQRETAAIAIRALMARVVDASLTGWVMIEREQEESE